MMKVLLIYWPTLEILTSTDEIINISFNVRETNK